jgi:hypothetical protein
MVFWVFLNVCSVHAHDSNTTNPMDFEFKGVSVARSSSSHYDLSAGNDQSQNVQNTGPLRLLHRRTWRFFNNLRLYNSFPSQRM